MATKQPELTINLFGANGHREIEITPRGGFPTRHIKAPRANMMPSIFDDDEVGEKRYAGSPKGESDTSLSETSTPERTTPARKTIQKPARVRTPKPDPKPVQSEPVDLQALLAKVDEILDNGNAKPRAADCKSVLDIQVERGFKFVSDAIARQKAYEKHNNIPTKRAFCKWLANYMGVL